MKTKIIILLLVIAQPSFSQGLFGKLVAKAAKMLAGATVIQTTSSLDNVVVTGGILTHMHPAEVGSMDQAWYEGWKTGGDLTAFMFSRKDGWGFYKIDGTVAIDGVPTEYISVGSYCVITDNNPSSRKVEITTSTGQKASFSVAPIKKYIKILSINGQKDNISLDLTKDVTMQLETNLEPGTMLKISIGVTQLSMKSFVETCYLRSGAEIKIPPAAFRNMAFTPASTALYNFKKCFLKVIYEELVQPTEVSGPISFGNLMNMYDDGKFVKITTEPVVNTGLFTKGQDKEMNYSFMKPGAFRSRPSSQLKKLGVSSFAIRGTTYKKYKTRTETETAIYTTTTTLEFPQQPNEVWDALLEKMYPDFMKVFEEELNVSVLPIDNITNAPSYNSVLPYAKDDTNTKVKFARSYKNTKVVSAFVPVAEGYGVNSVSDKVMNETGADALLTMTIDLEVSVEDIGTLMIMTPKFGFEISGKSNGFTGNTKYSAGNILSTKGVPFSSKLSIEDLEGIVRKTDMLTVLRKGLKELKEKEMANGDYEVFWDLQK